MNQNRRTWLGSLIAYVVGLFNLKLLDAQESSEINNCCKVDIYNKSPSLMPALTINPVWVNIALDCYRKKSITIRELNERCNKILVRHENNS